MQLYVSKYMYVICSDLVGPDWDQQIYRWLLRTISTYREFKKYTCSRRCGVDERNASLWIPIKDLPNCFCDKLCDEFGDCCFDFNAL